MDNIELRELAKLSWRAMCDAEAVIRTVDPESAAEGEQLRELCSRLTDCAMHLFTALREPTQEWAAARAGLADTAPAGIGEKEK